MVNTNIIRESILPVIEKSKNVEIRYSAIRDIIDLMKDSKFEHWLKISPFDISSLTKKDQVAFAFVLDSISFSYWGDPKWTVEYKNRLYDGTKAMMACIGRAIEEGTPILNPTYLKSISYDEFGKIFRGNVPIPLAEERRIILQELGRKTIEAGGFRYIIEAAGGNVDALLKILIKIFPYFVDHAIYNGHKIYFYKRAQLLTADLYYLLKGTRHELSDIGMLTACADYKIPQVLQKLRILEYSKGLSQKIYNRNEIIKGSEEEIEIRANTIFVIDIIANILGISANAANDFVWLLGQQESFDDNTNHRTRTTAY